MFKIFKSRPPIIIINEAEHKEPVQVLKEKTIWEKYVGIICSVTIVLHFVAITFTLNIMNDIKHNQMQANNILLTKLQLSDSLYNAAIQKQYAYSMNTEKRYANSDSINKIVFSELYKQLKLIEKQNKQYFKMYQASQEAK